VTAPARWIAMALSPRLRIELPLIFALVMLATKMPLPPETWLPSIWTPADGLRGARATAVPEPAVEKLFALIVTFRSKPSEKIPKEDPIMLWLKLLFAIVVILAVVANDVVRTIPKAS